jgi:hypothetical protein
MSTSSKDYGLVLVGATSAIASAYTRLVIKARPRKVMLVLIGRNATALDEMAADLRARGAGAVTVYACDLAASPEPAAVVEAARAAVGRIDEVLVTYGSLPDQKQTQTEAGALEAALRINFTSTALWLQAFANVLADQKAGRLVVIGSVAGDRGRMSNYAYGAAKGGLERFVQGLQHSLAALPDVSVTLIKPGLVRTPMTAHMGGRGGLLWATPERVARDIFRAVERRRRSVYTPWFWWGIMAIIRTVPAGILQKTKL